MKQSLILQPLHRFTYVTAHPPTLPPLYLLFSNPSAAFPTSQFILQPFRCFTFVIGTSPTSPGEPLMPLWWCLIYPCIFCNVQWLQPARLYERCKLALELKRLKTPLAYAKHHTCLRISTSSNAWLIGRLFRNVQWLQPAGLYERCKLALELKSLKIPALRSHSLVSAIACLFVCFNYCIKICRKWISYYFP